MTTLVKLGASVAVIATALSLSTPALVFGQGRSRSGAGPQASGDSSSGQSTGGDREAGARTAQPRPAGGSTGTGAGSTASTSGAERGGSGLAVEAARPRSADPRGRVAVGRPLSGPGSVPRPAIPIYRYPYPFYPYSYYGGYPAYGFHYDIYGRLVPYRHYYGAGWYTPYDYYGPYGYGRTYVEFDRRDDDEADARQFGSLRLRVDPRSARVYVDGALAGVVDDFDGLKDHLRIEAGRHDIQFRADGLDPVSMTIDVDAGKTTTLRASLKASR